VKLTHYLSAILVGIGLASIPLSSSADFFSGNKLLPRLEASLDPKGGVYDSGVGIGYVQGATDALAQMNLVCVPTSATAGQVERIVHKYLVNRPERLHEGASFLVYVALREAFPCKGK
jgi:hypothetical protein